MQGAWPLLAFLAKKAVGVAVAIALFDVHQRHPATPVGKLFQFLA